MSESRNSADVLRIFGVGRDQDMAPALVVYFNRKPTDDEMRAVHELIGESERLRAEVARLRVKRCHYCDAPMRVPEAG